MFLLCLLDERPVMKSIVTSFHGPEGCGSAYISLYGQCLGIFTCWQMSHELTYFLTSLVIPFQKNLQLISSVIFLTPKWPASISSWWPINSSARRDSSSGTYNLSQWRRRPLPSTCQGLGFLVLLSSNLFWIASCFPLINVSSFWRLAISS